MNTTFIEKQITYNGTQLRSHWIYEQTELLGDAVVAFVGPCDVDVDHLVDLEDARHVRPIYSQLMLHFIVEFFDRSLKETILLQRLLISLIQQRLIQELGAHDFESLRRIGNDLYDGDHKLTVSIATTSPVSTLIHAGINIDSEGTPVPTKGLKDYALESAPFAEKILEDFREECQGLLRDLAKVRSVK